MVCFPEMLFLLSALAPYALSTVDQTCATAMGRDAPTPADWLGDATLDSDASKSRGVEGQFYQQFYLA